MESSYGRMFPIACLKGREVRGVPHTFRAQSFSKDWERAQ